MQSPRVDVETTLELGSRQGLKGTAMGEEIESGSGGNEGGEISINPAWNDLLGVIPEDLHEQVTPHLQNWDRGVQDRFQQVQSEWQDYGFLKENNITPDDTRIALGILRAVQEDPESVYNSLAETYGFGGETVTEENPGTDQGGAEGFSLPPEISKRLESLQSGYDAMAQILLQKQQEEEQQKQDADLQNEIDGLKKQHGNFDESYVLAYMNNGMSGEDAVKAYQNMVERIQTENARPKPPVLLGSSGGGVPGEKPIDPTKLNSQQTKSLVADFLRAHQQANQ